jgi:hypothetical protein
VNNNALARGGDAREVGERDQAHPLGETHLRRSHEVLNSVYSNRRFHPAGNLCPPHRPIFLADFEFRKERGNVRFGRQPKATVDGDVVV